MKATIRSASDPLGETVPRPAPRVEFHRHSLGRTEQEAVSRALDGLFLTTGEEVYGFEREFARYLDAPDVVAVSSCTSAEHLALLAAGITPGDEVITTPMTFIATITAILHAGAVPVLVDVDPPTGNLDPNQVEAAITPRTRAIVPVHLYGTMADVRALREIADAHGLALVEDAAHCVEGLRGGVRPGQLGDAACFSFYATKSLTCGEGGAIAVRDPEVATRIRRLRLHGMSANAESRYQGGYQHWDMVELGWKANLSNIQAAILRPQISRLDDRRKRREVIARAYDAVVDATPGLERPVIPADVHPAYWTEPARRDSILAHLGERGIGCAVNYRAVHELAWMRAHLERRFPLPHAEAIGARTISLPIYERLTDPEVARVADVLVEAASRA